LGNLEEGSSTRDFERRMKGALGMGLLSLKRLRGGGLGGETPSLGTPRKICPDSLRIWVSLSTGAPIVPRGTWCLGGGSYTGDFERWMKEGSFTGEL